MKYQLVISREKKSFVYDTFKILQNTLFCAVNFSAMFSFQTRVV